MSPNGISVPDSNVEVELIYDLTNIKKLQKGDVTKKPFKRQIVWENVVVYLAVHIMALYATYLIFTKVSIILTFYTISSGILLSEGVTMAAHRYYAHRTFKASKPLQICMLFLQTTTSQNCCWVWVRDHRQHHKYSDTDADPHNAKNGFFFSHVGWLLSRKHPDVIEKGKTIDMSDMDADPYVMFQKKHYGKLWLISCIIIPLLFPVFVLKEDLLTSFLVCIIFKVVLSLNITWLVNSWAHLYGNKPSIMPVESRLVGFLALGEGWHNYHHTFPMDYKTSEFGVPYNLTTTCIRLCARFGWAWDLKETTPEMIIRRAKRTGSFREDKSKEDKLVGGITYYGVGKNLDGFRNVVPKGVVLVTAK